MSGYQNKKAIILLTIFSFLTLAGCSYQETNQKDISYSEKSLLEKFEAEEVSVTFEKRKNQTTNKAWPDSFNCAVVQIIDSDYLSEAIDDEDFFDMEYGKIKKFLRDSAKTINSDNLHLALTVIDTLHAGKNKMGFHSYATKSKSVEPSLVTNN